MSTNDESKFLHEVASRHCESIKTAYTLREICERVDSCDYNAELILKHLLLWVSQEQRKTMSTKFNNLVDKALLERTAPELARGWVLYELLRKLSVKRFQQLVEDNVKGKGRFDDLVADLAGDKP